MTAAVFHIEPKTIREVYRGDTILIKYDPQAKVWHWKVTHNMQVELEGCALTMEKAKRAAKKRVDTMKGGK